MLRCAGRREPPDLIIVGLGNPGPEYAETRHNVGFRFIDKPWPPRYDIEISRSHRSVRMGAGGIDGRRVVLAKPRTYVNNSGAAARYLLARFRSTPDRLLLVYDDLDLPPGKIRLRPGGSPGSHNGVRSVTDALGSRDFPRLRIGVGRPEDADDQVAYVLGVPDEAERKVLDAALSRAAEAVRVVLANGVTEAMNRYQLRSVNWQTAAQPISGTRCPCFATLTTRTRRTSSWMSQTTRQSPTR